MILLDTLVPLSTAHAQVLETETARLPKQGKGEASVGYEFQTSEEGTESAIPLTFLIGLYDRLELSVEPGVYSVINPDVGKSATGIGDTEVTLTGLLLSEQTYLPAVAVAAEVKIPTARNSLIGTKRVRLHRISDPKQTDRSLRPACKPSVSIDWFSSGSRSARYVE